VYFEYKFLGFRHKDPSNRANYAYISIDDNLLILDYTKVVHADFPDDDPLLPVHRKCWLIYGSGGSYAFFNNRFSRSTHDFSAYIEARGQLVTI